MWVRAIWKEQKHTSLRLSGYFFTSVYVTWERKCVKIRIYLTICYIYCSQCHKSIKKYKKHKVKLNYTCMYCIVGVNLSTSWPIFNVYFDMLIIKIFVFLMQMTIKYIILKLSYFGSDTVIWLDVISYFHSWSAYVKWLGTVSSVLTLKSQLCTVCCLPL